MSSKDNLRAEEGLIGQVINDRYRIEALLGRGNVGVVYRALDQRENRKIALKIIKVDLAEEGMKHRFEHDADIVSKIEHPNAVTIHDHGLLGTGGGYFAMEFIEGKTLRDVLKDKKTLPLDQALKMLKQICSPLSAAHKLGVIHRDLKPENVMFPDSGGGEKLKVLDLGLAKIKEGVGASNANLTSAGEVMGTPCYMSPEQCLGTGVDERTDIYAIGIMLFEMLAGKPPFEGNFFSVLRMHMSKPIPSIKEFTPNVPPAVDDFLSKILDKEKDKRPRTVDDMLVEIEKLEKAVGGVSAAAPQTTAAPKPQPAPQPEPAKPPASQPPAVTSSAVPAEPVKSNMAPIIGVVVGIIMLLAIVLFLVFGR